jgi:hypothetical protein
MANIIKITEDDLVDIIKKILTNQIPNLDNLSIPKIDSTSNILSPSDDKIPDKMTSDDDFYKKVLACVGAKPTKGNMSFMYAWRQSEGAKANFNPFNTTMNMPGATIYNDSKVKNYKSMEDGVKATCDTLKLDNYRDIKEGLIKDVGLYKLSRMKGLKKWGTGPLLAKVADGYLAGATPKPDPIDTGIA